jgi:hypothetical protein
MKTKFLLRQLEKLFEGKVILVLEQKDFETLVIAAVPQLESELEHLTWEIDVLTPEEQHRERQLKRLVKELETLPHTGQLFMVTGDDEMSVS